MTNVASDQTPSAFTRSLSEYVARESAQSIPQDVLARARYVILDGLGCGIYGSTLPWTRLLADSILRLDGAGPSRVWGMAATASVSNAALLNGASVQAYELDDYSRLGALHGCALILPAVFAAGRLLDDEPTFDDVVRSTVVGLEVGNRLGMAVGSANILERGWHSGAVIGPQTAAAAVGSLLHLTADEMNHAFGIASTQASGLMSAQYGSMVKRMHHGIGARNGLQAAWLAAQGYTGIEGVFDLPYGGFLSTFAGNFDSARLAEISSDLGADYKSRKTCIKPYSCNASIHVAIDAVLDLLPAEERRAANVDAIEIGVTKSTLEHVGWRFRATGSPTEAQMNMSFAVAQAIRHGDVFVDQFVDDELQSDEVAELIGRITIVHDAELDRLGDDKRHSIRMSLRLSSGEVRNDERHFGKGSIERPLHEGDIEDKFRKLVAASRLPVDADYLVGLARGTAAPPITHVESIFVPAPS